MGTAIFVGKIIGTILVMLYVLEHFHKKWELEKRAPPKKRPEPLVTRSKAPQAVAPKQPPAPVRVDSNEPSPEDVFPHLQRGKDYDRHTVRK